MAGSGTPSPAEGRAAQKPPRLPGRALAPAARSLADLSRGALVARVLAREGVGGIVAPCGGHVLPISAACLDVILHLDAYRRDGGGSLAI